MRTNTKYEQAALATTSAASSIVWVVLATATFGYLVPAALASVRHTRNRMSVLIVNVLLGWTILGWIVALAMAGGGTEPRW